MKSKAIIIQNGAASLSDFTLRELAVGEILVRAEFTCISPGTELRMMRLSAEGVHKEAFIPGYALVGIVEDSRSKAIQIGQRIYCGGTCYGGELQTSWGGHCEHAIAVASNCVLVPDLVEPLAASLTAMGAIAHHGFTKSMPQPGERVVHVGLGVLGQLSARLHAQAGAEVLACDLSPIRVAMSNAAGVRAIIPSAGMAAAVAKAMPQGPSLVVDSTGVLPVIEEAVKLIPEIPWDDNPEPNNRYMIQGSYAGNFSLPYQTAFVRQLSFIIPRNRQRSDCEAFLNLVASQKINVDDLIVKVLKPESATAAFEALKDPVQTPGTIAFDWRI